MIKFENFSSTGTIYPDFVKYKGIEKNERNIGKLKKIVQVLEKFSNFIHG